MITIDRTRPEGNVFCILGYAKSFQRQLKSAGGNNEVLDCVLANFTSMEYDEICEKLESTGLFKFNDGDDEEDGYEDDDEDCEAECS